MNHSGLKIDLSKIASIFNDATCFCLLGNRWKNVYLDSAKVCIGNAV